MGSDTEAPNRTPARRAAGDFAGGRTRSIGLAVGIGLLIALLLPTTAYFLLARPAPAPSGPPPVNQSVADPSESIEPIGSPMPTIEWNKMTADQQVEACQAKAAAGDRLVDQSRTTIRDYTDHLRATTDYEDGLLSVSQRGAVWKRTLERGAVELKKQQTSQGNFDALPGCGWIAGSSNPQGARMDRCSQRINAAYTALTAARKPIDDWRQHVNEDDRRSGDLVSYADWERSWEDSKTDVDAWVEADKKYALAPVC